MDNASVEQQKLVYCWFLVDRETLFEKADEDLDSIKHQMKKFIKVVDDMEKILHCQRQKIASLGGYIINTSISKTLDADQYAYLLDRVEEIQSEIDKEVPDSTELLIEPLDDEDNGIEVALFTDRKALLPVIRIVNKYLDDKSALTPFEAKKITMFNQRLPNIDTKEQALAYQNSYRQRNPSANFTNSLIFDVD